MPSSVVHIIITLIAIPISIYLVQRLVNKKDAAEKQIQDERHQNILNSINSLTDKVKGFCDTNRTEHKTFFGYGTKIETISTIMHQRGCDQPYMRRSTDPEIANNK